MKKVLITLACVMVVGLGAVAIKAHMSGNQPNGDKLTFENTEQTEVLTPEEQAYLEETDRKLSIKFGVGTADNITVDYGMNKREDNLSFVKKKILWDFLINDLKCCERSDIIPEPVSGYTRIKIGDIALTTSAHNHDDKYNFYFELSTESNTLYKVSKENYYAWEYDFKTENGKYPNKELKEYIDWALSFIHKDADTEEMSEAEKQRYIADIDKKLRNKFGIGTDDAIILYKMPNPNDGKLSFAQKSSLWELLNAMEYCESVKKDNYTAVEGCIFEIKNKIICKPEYGYTEEPEPYVYYKILDLSDDKIDVYKISRELYIAYMDRFATDDGLYTHERLYEHHIYYDDVFTDITERLMNTLCGGV